MSPHIGRSGIQIAPIADRGEGAESIFIDSRLGFRLVAETNAVEILILAVELELDATVLPSVAIAMAEAHGRVIGIPLKGRPLQREMSLKRSVSAARSLAVQASANHC